MELHAATNKTTTITTNGPFYVRSDALTKAAYQLWCRYAGVHGGGFSSEENLPAFMHVKLPFIDARFIPSAKRSLSLLPTSFHCILSLLVSETRICVLVSQWGQFWDVGIVWLVLTSSKARLKVKSV